MIEKTGKAVDGSIPLHTTFNQTLFVRLQTTFSAPGMKGPPGASSVWIVCPSVRLSVHLSVCPLYPLFRPAYKQSAIFKVVVVI